MKDAFLYIWSGRCVEEWGMGKYASAWYRQQEVSLLGLLEDEFYIYSLSDQFSIYTSIYDVQISPLLPLN